MSREQGDERAQVRGELVTVIGPTPPDWSGLGSTYRDDAVLVMYPDGETGSAPRALLRDVATGKPAATPGAESRRRAREA